MRLTRRLILASVSLLAAGIRTSRAQANAPVRIRGTITSVQRDSVAIETKAGAVRSIKLGGKVSYGWVTPISLSAVKKGAYIGTAAVDEPDGSLKALEIHVFPESMRGAGEGFRGWDLGKDSSMTNGTIGDVTQTDGETLHVTYNGGEKIVHIPPGTPIVTFEPATANMVLKPGMHVIVAATEGADGSAIATSIRGGKNGIVPPM